MRRALLLPALLALLAVLAPQQAWAHAALVRASPVPGAALERPPQEVRLTFSEAIEPSVSEIHVLDAKGNAVETGRAVGAGNTTLRVPVGELSRGDYTVDWRVVSADDGHATAGSYKFGVQTTPSGAVTSTSSASSSALEVVARFAFLIGMIALFGATVATLARFGGAGRSDLVLAAAGWCVAAVGLALLAEAQRRNAGSSLGTLLETPTGHALIHRAVTLAAAGVALLIAWRRPRIERGAMLAAGLAALAAIGVHVGAGHASSGPWPDALTIAAQLVHFAAAGAWFGGLAALLLGFRGRADAENAAAARRFGVVAAAAFALVVATGTVRAVDELSSFGQLTSSGYGRAILAKIAIVGVIALIAVRNRRDVRSGVAGLQPLRRRARAELALAVAAIALAALLGTSAPPTPAITQAPRGLSASGSDSTGAVQAQLTTAAARPGANRFVVQLSGDALDSTETSVALRFTPLDDPGIAPTNLALRPAGDGSYVGTGRNLKFDGRWRVTALVNLASGSVAVPMELDVPGPKYFVSVQHIPGQPPKYTMQVGGVGYIRLVVVPERAGPNQIFATSYTTFGGVSKVATLVVTTASGDGPASQAAVHRLTSGRFVAHASLAAGPETIAVTARTRDGTRLRGEFHIQIPAA